MDPLIIPIVALVIPIIIVPTAMGIKHARFLREVEHAERMRAMELGRPLDEDETWTPAGIVVTIGAGVPVASMLIAWLASRSYGIAGGSVVESIWKMAGMVGLGGVICGSILASQMLMKRDQPAPAVDEKPEFDPEAFDVVGRRG